MKNAVSTFLFLILILNAVAQLPSCDGDRYKKNVFGEIDSAINVQYGQNNTMNNVHQDLMMDIYQPHADTAGRRPLIIFMLGGGFVSGSKEDCRSICMLFALKGFVTATIDYRLIDVPLADSITVAEGMIQAVGDAKAAVRFFVGDAATANLYRIDTNYIFISGASAGGVIAAHVAFLDSADNVPSYMLNLISGNGGFSGNSSTNTAHTLPIKGVINYSGALWRKEFISSGEPALFSVHDICNNILSVNSNETVETGVQLFPNPAGKEISIVFPVNLTGKEKIQLFSSTGKLLSEIETDHSITLNISGLPAGLYFIHLQNQPEKRLKFIKQ